MFVTLDARPIWFTIQDIKDPNSYTITYHSTNKKMNSHHTASIAPVGYGYL